MSTPTSVTAEFKEFFWLGRAMRVTISIGEGGVVHLSVVYGYQGSEEESQKLLLTDNLLGAVLAEAQAVCVGHPVLIVGV